MCRERCNYQPDLKTWLLRRLYPYFDPSVEKVLYCEYLDKFGHLQSEGLSSLEGDDGSVHLSSHILVMLFDRAIIISLFLTLTSRRPRWRTWTR